MLKHLLYSQDNIKMTFCLVFIIWFIILLIVRKKVGNNPAKSKVWKCLCLVPLAAAIIHFFVFSFGDAVLPLLEEYGFIYASAVLTALLPLFFIKKSKKPVKIIGAVVIGVVCLLSLFFNIDSSVSVNYSNRDLKSAYISLCDYFEENYIMNEWKKPDYEKIKADGLKLIDEAEKTGDITKYYEAVDEFTNSFYDGHMGISFYDGNDYRITRIKQFNDYGLSLITLDDGTTIAVDVEDGLEIKNGDTVTKWNGVPIDQAIENGNVRGTINVAEHIRKNTPFIGNISYSQREYSYDNYLIELIRHTIEYIKGKNYGRMLLNSVKDEVKLITEATPNYKAGNRRKIIEANRKNVVRHAYYHEYRALQQLCILILKNEQHQYGNGARKVYGILFDGAWLWEEYVNSLIGEIFYHPMNKAGSGAQRLFSGNYGFIYPDFISKSESNRVIADAKYKPIDNIGNKDYLQVLAYMFRFDAKKGFFLYPESGDIQDLLLSLNKGTTYENNVAARDDIAVIKHGLKIPFDASDYAEFSEKMKAEEERFMTIFS